MHKGKSVEWVKELYSNLSKLLNQIFFTGEGKEQDKLLDKVYN